jgi:hypothetical protein
LEIASGPGTALIAAAGFGVGISVLTLFTKIIKMGKILNFSYSCCRMNLFIIIFAYEEEFGRRVKHENQGYDDKKSNYRGQRNIGD